MKTANCCIIGGGIEALLTARQIKHLYPDQRVIILNPGDDLFKSSTGFHLGGLSYCGYIYLSNNHLNQLNQLLKPFINTPITASTIPELPLYLWNDNNGKLVRLSHNGGKENSVLAKLHVLYQRLQDCQGAANKTKLVKQYFGQKEVNKKAKDAEQKSLIEAANLLALLLRVEHIHMVPGIILQECLSYFLAPSELVAIDLHSSKLVQILIKSLESQDIQVVNNAVCNFVNFDQQEEIVSWQNIHTSQGEFQADRFIFAQPLHSFFEYLPKSNCPPTVITTIVRTTPVSGLLAEYRLTVDALLLEEKMQIFFPKLNLILNSHLVDMEENNRWTYQFNWMSLFFDSLSAKKKEAGKVLKSIKKATEKLTQSSWEIGNSTEKIKAVPYLFSRSYLAEEIKHYMKHNQDHRLANIIFTGDGIGKCEPLGTNTIDTIFNLPLL